MSPSEPKPGSEPPGSDALPQQRASLADESNFRTGFARWMRPDDGVSGSGVGLGITVAVSLLLAVGAVGFWCYLKAHMH